MKREYVRPIAVVEKFAANEYVAACESTMVTYNFKCTAPATDNVWLETNNKPGLQKNPSGWSWDSWSFESSSDADLIGRGWWSGSYHPCNKTHSVTVEKGTDVSNIFHPGYLDDGTEVIVWRGENNDNVHCQIGLSGNDVEVVRS